MDKLYISDLYSFYNGLLTKTQKDVIYMHCLEDYSFSEIAEILNITRAAAYDAYKKGSDKLLFYELNLSMHKSYNERAKIIDNIISKIDDNDIINELKELKE